MQTDPIADMLTRIRNAVAKAEASVDVPASKFKLALGQVLLSAGYLKSIESVDKDGKPFLRIGLKYGHKRTPVIHSLKRVSTPGRRAYTKAEHVPVVRGGLGLAVVSTSQGLLVGSEARRQNIGGEIVCEVW